MTVPDIFNSTGVPITWDHEAVLGDQHCHDYNFIFNQRFSMVVGNIERDKMPE